MDENDKTLAQLLDIRDDKGRAALTVGLFATFYLEAPWTRPVREAVAAEADRHVALVQDRLVWGKDPKTANYHRLDKRRIPTPGAWLPQHEDGKVWEFGFHGGEVIDAASSFHVDGLGGDAAYDELGYFRIGLPLDWFAKHPGSLPDFVLPICQALRPVSGYAGIGLLMPMTVEGRQASESLILPLAQRFPGAEVDHPGTSTIHLATGIKGVNWLTILGDRWVEAAGGLDYLRIRLDEANYKLYPYGGGLMIQAGARPQIGDADSNRWPTNYVTLARVLKKIQVKDHYPFFSGNHFTQTATREWLYRFDGK
jgi:hypothetical protein